MRRNSILLVCSFIVVLTQTTLSSVPYISHVHLTLASIICATLFFGLRMSGLWTLFCGLWLESFSIFPFGVTVILMLGIWLLAYIAQRTIFTDITVQGGIATSLLCMSVYWIVSILLSYALVAIDSITIPITLNLLTTRMVLYSIVSSALTVGLCIAGVRIASQRLNFAFIGSRV